MALFGFPLLLIPFAVYNIVAFLMPGVGFATPVFHVTLYSSATWDVSAGDLLLAFALLMLLAELIKAARLGRRSIVDHGLAFLLLIAMAAEFVMVPRVATSIFSLLIAISFVDAFGGVAIAIALRRAERRIITETHEPAPASPEPAPPPQPAQPPPSPQPSAPASAPAESPSATPESTSH